MKQNPIYHRNPGNRSQTGAALVISLIMLLLLTIIGITAMQSTTMQERMSGNARDRDMAFQNAEAAINDGEAYLTQASVGPFLSTTNADGYYIEDTSGTAEWWDQAATWATGGSATGTLTFPSGSKAESRYIVEQLTATVTTGGSIEAGVAGVPLYFRVSARGVGAAGTAVVLLQSTFKR